MFRTRTLTRRAAYGGVYALVATLAVAMHAAAAPLPDNRAYEMVSPPEKNGGDVMAESSRTRSAADGGAVGFSSLSGFADAIGASVGVEYISVRNGRPSTNGWSTHAITPKMAPLTFSGVIQGMDPLYTGEFAPDLSRGVFRAWLPLTDVPNAQNIVNLYVRDDLLSPGGNSYELLTNPIAPLPASVSKPALAGASADFKHVAFESTRNLTADATGGSVKLYEWDEGQLRIAGVLPDGSVAGSSRAGFGATSLLYTPGVVSSDGSRIFAQANPGSTGEVLMRMGGSTTVQLNRSERSSPDSSLPGSFWASSSDGTRAFFTTSEGLVEGDDNGSEDLYMWEQQPGNETQAIAIAATGGDFRLTVRGQTTTPIAFDASAATVQSALVSLRSVGPGNVIVSGGPDDAGASAPYAVTFVGRLAGVNVEEMTVDGGALTGGAGTATVTTPQPIANLARLSIDRQDPEDSPVTTVIGASRDGRYVYFTSSGQLVPNQSAPVGAGLYLWHDGAVTFIGGLADTGDLFRNGPLTNWNFILEKSTARVSPDGRHLLFMSRSDAGLRGHGGFGGYDHGTTCTFDSSSGGPCREMYLYSADTGKLVCASCNPTGSRATADALIQHKTGNGGTSTTSHLSHALSDDGRYVFFSTAEALVPDDTNGKIDAYAYDTVAGAPRLISTGRSPSDSFFLDASARGDDVFFTTRESLVGWDGDSSYDLYDARIDGGFPEPVAPAPRCSGDVCQGPPAVPPAAGAGLLGAAFRGAGDANGAFKTKPKARQPRRCRRSSVRNRVRGRARCRNRRSSGHRRGTAGRPHREARGGRR